MFEGDAVRSDRAVLPLSEYERHRVNEAKARSAKALGKSAAEVRNKHDKELAEKISAKSGHARRRLRFALSRRDIAACFSRMSNWSLITWASLRSRPCWSTRTVMSVRHLLIPWRASITGAARPWS